jgi:hypothetical protein
MLTKMLGRSAALVGVVCLLASGCGNQDQAESQHIGVPDDPVVIDPGVCVGKVRYGMTLAEVRSELGEPQRTTPNALEYTRLGFAVMPGADGRVQVVMCGDVMGMSGPLVKKFRAKTKEGIGLGSTRDELVRTYGDPSRDEKFLGARESMKYDALGITFSLEAGKVHHLIVRLGKTPEAGSGSPRMIEISP